jgi:hypothetical protein
LIRCSRSGASDWVFELVAPFRRDAAVWRIVDLRPRHLTPTPQVVTAVPGVTNKAAESDLDQLAEADVLLQ